MKFSSHRDIYTFSTENESSKTTHSRLLNRKSKWIHTQNKSIYYADIQSTMLFTLYHIHIIPCRPYRNPRRYHATLLPVLRLHSCRNLLFCTDSHCPSRKLDTITLSWSWYTNYLILITLPTHPSRRTTSDTSLPTLPTHHFLDACGKRVHLPFGPSPKS
jgi:hypothetical protein